MRLLAVLAVVVVVACGDSTDISGTYVGNYTLVVAGSASAGSGEVTIAGDTVVLADGCALATVVREQQTVADKTGYSHFIFTSEDIVAGQPCALLAIAFAIDEGELLVQHGGTLMLGVGGAMANGGYAVYDFTGATP